MLETIRLKFHEHKHKVITFGIMTAISFALTIALTGNVHDVFAPHRGR